MTEALKSVRSVNLDRYVPAGASIVETTEVDGLLVHTLASDEYEMGEQVILEITEPKGVACLWEPGEQGSSLAIKTLAGRGSLVKTDIGAVEWQRIALAAGVEAEVKPGTIYWYENQGEPGEPLLVLDTCPGFVEEHEPTVAQVHEYLQKIDFGTL